MGLSASNSDGANDANDAGPSTPQISVPKGGGAIHGIGEEFSANPVTGTAALSVPLVPTGYARFARS
jgi:hypothetical protein